MDARLAHGYLLTIHLSGEHVSPDLSQVVLEDLAHLTAVLRLSTAGDLVLTCTVSAPTEAEAVRYGAQRTITAMVIAGIEDPRVVSVDAHRFDDVLV